MSAGGTQRVGAGARSRPGPPGRGVRVLTTLASGALLAAIVISVASPAARACQSCFGAEDSPLLDGARSGLWFLLGVTVAMQAGFAAFFIYLWRRSRWLPGKALGGESVELQRASRCP